MSTRISAQPSLKERRGRIPLQAAPQHRRICRSRSETFYIIKESQTVDGGEEDKSDHERNFPQRIKQTFWHLLPVEVKKLDSNSPTPVDRYKKGDAFGEKRSVNKLIAAKDGDQPE